MLPLQSSDSDTTSPRLAPANFAVSLVMCRWYKELALIIVKDARGRKGGIGKGGSDYLEDGLPKGLGEPWLVRITEIIDSNTKRW